MPRVRLGELLLSRGACTHEALAAAWEQQVLFGDRLGTNLLAVHAVDEATLAAALGAQHGVHHGSGDVLRVDECVVPLVPRSLCLARLVLPHHVVDRTLYLLMADPTDLRVIDEVRFATRLKVQPIVVCEARLWDLLSTWLGESPSLRPNPLTAPWRPRPTGPTTPSTEGAPIDDLVSEAEFNALYARTGQAGGAAALIDADGAPTAPPVAEPPTWNNAVTRPMRLPLVPGQVAEPSSPPTAPEPMLAPPRTRPATLPGLTVPASMAATTATAAPVFSLEQAQEWQRSLEHTAPSLARPGLPGAEVVELVEVVDFEPETVPPDAPMVVTPPPPPDRSPVSFVEATRLLASAQDRNDIVGIVLRAARARFARAALLMVHPHAFVGWQGLGAGFEDIARVSVPRDVPSVFALVADSNAHYLGPLQRQPAHGAWVKATGKRIPRSVVVLPILVRGRTVSLLVADNGHDQHVDGDVGELLILARHIAASWENLLARGV
jgi:hypothetical protein